MTTLAEAIGSEKRIIGGPFGSKLTQKDYIESGVPVIRGGNMQDSSRWIGGDYAFVSDAKYLKDLKSNTADRGNIIVTQRGTLGQVSIVPDDAEYEKFVVSQSQMAISVDPNKADRDFVYYYLTSSLFLDYINSTTIQTGVPHINLGILRNFEIEWPTLDEQKSIGRVLSSLDDKIDHLQKMNTTLEEIARAVFRAWFVDFEPVRAKAAGATSFRGIPQNLFDTLPGGFSPSEIGDIPTGWTVEPIGSLADCVGGGTPSTKNPAYWEDGLNPFCTPKDMSRLSSVTLLDTERHLTDAGVDKISSGALPVGTVLLSSRAPIGYIAINYRPVSINQGIIAMKPTVLPAEYLRFWLEANMETIKSNAGGTTFAEISKSKFRPILALNPCAEAVAEYSKLTRNNLEHVAANELEIQTLAVLRDTLLPKLISGELEAPSLEALGLEGGE